jgi:hypothetical protein
MCSESPENLPLALAVLPESDIQKFQFIRQAVLVTKISGPEHQYGKYRMLFGWVVIRRGVG